MLSEVYKLLIRPFIEILQTRGGGGEWGRIFLAFPFWTLFHFANYKHIHIGWETFRCAANLVVGAGDREEWLKD